MDQDDPSTNVMQVVTDIGSVKEVDISNEISTDSDLIEASEVTPDGVVTPLIIVASQGSEMAGGQEVESGDPETSQPATKRFKVEQNDGQTYYLTVTNEGATINRSLVLEEEATAIPAETAQRIIASASNGTDLDITQAWFTTRDEKNTLHSKGYQWKQGQWSKEEVDLLQANIDQYCRQHGVNDPTEIIFMMSKDERKDFYRTIARGLHRPLFSVYRRVIRMYDQKNHIGKYSKQEISKLRELHIKHGSDWATIGAALGRSASSVKDRCRLMKDTCNSGKWLPEEEERLTRAVYELSGAEPGDSVTSGLSWAAVADKVQTRSEKQCRTKWLNYLNWKQKGGTEWTREDDIRLVNKISECGATDENEIDWEVLTQGWPSARSPQWLRGKWWSIKRHMQDYQILPFQEVVEYIKKMLPENLKWKSSATPKVPVLNPGVGQQGVVSVAPIVISPSAVSTTVTVAESNDTEASDQENQYQAFEVLQGLSPASSGAYLITQPQTNPAISLAPGGVPTDHIIVHTLPVPQMGTEVDQSDGEMMIQVNPGQPQHIIIHNTGQNDVSSINAASIEDRTVHLTHCMGQPDTDLQTLTQPDGIQTVVSVHEVNQSDLDEAADMTSQAEIISAQDNFESQAIADGAMSVEVSQSDDLSADTAEQPDLGIVTAGSPQFVQSSSGRKLFHMSDPMLPADSTESSELIGASSDVETEKVPSGSS